MRFRIWFIILTWTLYLLKTKMELKDIFDILIHQEAFEGANFDVNSKSLMLVEKPLENNKTQLLSVTIKGIDEVYAAIKLDTDRRDFLRPDGLIRSCEGETDEARRHDAHKKCDYLVFCRVNTQNYVLLIEMKSDEAKHIPEKIKSSKAILAYFIELIRLCYDYELTDFKQIAILFDKNSNKSITELERGNVKFKHQGFYKEQNGITLMKHLINQK
jgi:hypothetical protein